MVAVHITDTLCNIMSVCACLCVVESMRGTSSMRNHPKKSN